MVPQPQGAVEPEDYTHIDFCLDQTCVHNAVAHLARVTDGRPYATPISFSVVDA
jgi:hypothetical protein